LESEGWKTIIASLSFTHSSNLTLPAR
jgi:hypothetical protein